MLTFKHCRQMMTVRSFVPAFKLVSQIEIRPVIAWKRRRSLFGTFRMKTLPEMETVLADQG